MAVVYAISAVVASDGQEIPIDSLPQTLSYTNGILDYIQVSYNAGTYRQTYTYTNGNLTSISGWVKQ